MNILGGLRAASGGFTVALAAKHFSVPVIVLVPMFKMSPVFLFNYEQEAFNLVGSTQSVLPYNTKVSRQVKAYSPAFDYVPPRLITLFISSTWVSSDNTCCNPVIWLLFFFLVAVSHLIMSTDYSQKCTIPTTTTWRNKCLLLFSFYFMLKIK